MPARTDSFDLAGLSIQSGEARRLDLEVAPGDFVLGTEHYSTVPAVVPVRLELSRMMGNGWALRLQFTARLEGPCVRCLADASLALDVDAREVEQPGGGEELSSPYVHGDELDVRGWAHDALALALPLQILCREDCAGLCPECGANRNEDPGHAHEAAADPRWAKLDELKFD